MYSFKTVISHISLLFIGFSGKTNAKEIINILINKPDIGENQFLDNYNNVMNQYFTLNNIPDVEVKFSYCTPNPEDGTSLENLYKSFNSPFSVDKDYANKFNCTLRELKQANFDLMLLDDRFLFSDNSYIDNTILQGEFSYNKLTDYLEILKPKDETINHHDKALLNDGHLGTEDLYGLPYEFDFDVLYYHDTAADIKDSLAVKAKDIQNISGDNAKNIVSIGLIDNDELLNLYSEFARYQYNTPKEGDLESYKLLYKEDLFNALRNYINSLTGNDMNKTLSTTIEEAYNSFVKGEKPLLKGKASLYSTLNKNQNQNININQNQNQNVTVHANALPDNKSVIYEKYIVINKKSSKPKNILEQVALQLTSKEMQQYRASQFGSIPTFDFKNQNENSNSYCQDHAEICDLLKALDPIRVPTVFREDRYSASFLESRLVTPVAIRQTLSDPKNDVAQRLVLNVLEIWNRSLGGDKKVEIDSFLIMFLILNVITIAVAIYLLVIIVKVYRNRKHPYIKAMSPQLTNLTIFGIILRTLYPYTYNVISTRFLCRMSSVLSFFINNLVYIPLFAIIFRIYYIYTNISSVSYGSKLHDKRLIIYIIIALIISFIAYYGISTFDTFNLTTTGSVTFNRMMICMYDFDKHSLITNIYTLILFVVMMAMTIKVRKLSKKYGDTRFILFIVLLLVASFFSQIGFAAFFKTDGASSVTTSSMVLILIHMIFSIITVYFLIGNRLLFIKKHPIKNKKKLYKNDFNNINNLVNFIPMKMNNSSSFTFFDSSTGLSTSKNSTSNAYVVMSNPNLYSGVTNTNTNLYSNTNSNINNNSFAMESSYRSIGQNLNKYLNDDNKISINQFSSSPSPTKESNISNINPSFYNYSYTNNNSNFSSSNNNSENSSVKNSYYYYNKLSNGM